MTQSPTPVDVEGLRALLAKHGLVITDDPDFDHDEATFDKALRALLDELTALRQQAGNGVPEGWRLVPVEPTLEMHNAAQDAFPRSAAFVFPKIWSAMLTASPQPPEPTVSADAPEKAVAGDWTGGRAWPELLEQVAQYWAEWEENRAGRGTYTPEELAEDAGEFATGLADHLATPKTPDAPEAQS